MIAALGLSLLAASALAQTPVIRPGREAEIMALASPYGLGEEVVAGWRLESISIDRSVIHFELHSSSDASARLTLHHPEFAPDDAERIASFAVELASNPGSEDATSALLEALRNNDDGAFWEVDPAAETARVLRTGALREPSVLRRTPYGSVGLGLGAAIVCVLGLFLFGKPEASS